MKKSEPSSVIPYTGSGLPTKTNYEKKSTHSLSYTLHRKAAHICTTEKERFSACQLGSNCPDSCKRLAKTLFNYVCGGFMLSSTSQNYKEFSIKRSKRVDFFYFCCLVLIGFLFAGVRV